jgi:two-component system nitrate/nitrite response regulator NarL
VTQAPQSIRLIVIDEDPAFLRALSRVVDGAESAMAILGTPSSVAEGVLLAEKCQPDVILLDMGGHDDACIDAIPRLAAVCSARILMLDTVLDLDSTARAVTVGARGVVLKSDAPELIRKAVVKVMEGEIWLDRLTTGRIVGQLSAALAESAEFAETAAAGTNGNGNGEVDKLTARELEVVRALLEHDGAGSRTLAAGLQVSEHTLRNHFTSIYRKLGVPNRTGLFAYASRLGLGRAH